MNALRASPSLRPRKRRAFAGWQSHPGWAGPGRESSWIGWKRGCPSVAALSAAVAAVMANAEGDRKCEFKVAGGQGKGARRAEWIDLSYSGPPWGSKECSARAGYERMPARSSRSGACPSMDSLEKRPKTASRADHALMGQVH